MLEDSQWKVSVEGGVVLGLATGTAGLEDSAEHLGICPSPAPMYGDSNESMVLAGKI